MYCGPCQPPQDRDGLLEGAAGEGEALRAGDHELLDRPGFDDGRVLDEDDLVEALPLQGQGPLADAGAGHAYLVGDLAPACPLPAALFRVAADGSADANAQGEQAAAEPVDQQGPVQMIAAADPAEGEKVARKCVACHSFDQGGPNKVGPNLYNVVGGPVAHLEDYNYSSAFEELHEAGETWTYDQLWTYLQDPRGTVPGTKMSFAGLKKDDELAAVIAYLRQQTENPPPLEP